MSARYRFNASLYKENTRPRQLRGYLAYSGLDAALDRVADTVPTLHARRTFEALVPEEIHRECEIVLFRDGELSVYAGRSAVASWLRNRHRRLLTGFAEKRIEIKKLTFYVSPAGVTRSNRPVAPPPAPARGASDVVSQGARHIDDPGLKDALERLAARLAEREER